MCGIYGVINKKTDRELAVRCLDTLTHPGPDGSGLWQGGWGTGGFPFWICRIPEASQCPMQTGATG